MTASLDTPQPQAPAPALSPSVEREAAAEVKGAPTDCLPRELRAVLADVAARFGPVTTVSTVHLHTDNHSPGSTREKLHHACKAVDFRVRASAYEVMDYLRARPEIAGINAYRNGVIHIDFDENFRTSGRSARSQWPRPAGSRPTAQQPGDPPAAPTNPSLFTPAEPDSVSRGDSQQ
jgi:hypothetical protein